MFEAILDAIIDSIKILPILFIVYMAIELIEIKGLNKLNINKDIRNKIFVLKNKCNESIHYNDEVDNANSKDVINRLVEICRWLIEAKIDKKVDTLINDNIEMLKKKQNELTEAFKKNDFAAVSRISEEIKVLSEQQNKDIIDLKSDDEVDDGRYLSK